MQIDWLTVIAQIVNFLILVWLLKRLLYQPVVAAMTRREQLIAGKIGEAERRESEAAQRIRDYTEKTDALERSREQQFAAAAQEAEAEKRRLLAKSRAEVAEQHDKWRESVQHEHEDLRKSVKREILHASIEIARRALTDLADASLEDRVVATLLGRLESLSRPELDALAGANGRIRVASSFDLGPKTREQIAAALGTKAIDYVHDDALVCGISLRGHDHKLEWNIGDYVDDFEARLDTLLGTTTAPEAAA
jgi:F-type H+-transporting ATPase subunit b